MVPAQGVEFEFFDTGYGFFKIPKHYYVEFPLTERMAVKPVALTEPLKVRVITCGQSWVNYTLSGAQKAIWDALQKHPWFVLTGRPVATYDIMVDRTKDWISVDYSAATDNLSSEVSRLICNYIARYTGLPAEFMYESLCEHSIKYKALTVEQRNGQLMGDKLSFPVLCIANAVALSLTVNPEEYNRNDPILVNGDDGLFLGQAKEYERWKTIASHLGLEPSIGKVYQSNKFCVINSMLFYYDGTIVRECPYPNASGIMTYDARTYNKPKTPLDLAESLQLWLSGFPSSQKISAEMLWYQTMDGILNTWWVKKYHIDYHVPQCLGGLGLPLRQGCEDYEIGRVVFARAKACMEGNRPWKFKSSGNEVIYNPLVESTTYRHLLSNIEMTPERWNSVRALGWSKDVKIESYSNQTYWYDMIANQGSSLSMAALSLLSGRDTLSVGKVLEEKRFSIATENSRIVRRKSNYVRYQPVLVSTLQGLQFREGSRKLKTWRPQYQTFDEITGLHYNKFINLVDVARCSQKAWPPLERT